MNRLQMLCAISALCAIENKNQNILGDIEMTKGLVHIPPNSKHGRSMRSAKGTGSNRELSSDVSAAIKREEQQAWNKLQDMKRDTKEFNKQQNLLLKKALKNET